MEKIATYKDLYNIYKCLSPIDFNMGLKKYMKCLTKEKFLEFNQKTSPNGVYKSTITYNTITSLNDYDNNLLIPLTKCKLDIFDASLNHNVTNNQTYKYYLGGSCVGTNTQVVSCKFYVGNKELFETFANTTYNESENKYYYNVALHSKVLSLTNSASSYTYDGTTYNRSDTVVHFFNNENIEVANTLANPSWIQVFLI